MIREKRWLNGEGSDDGGDGGSALREMVMNEMW